MTLSELSQIISKKNPSITNNQVKEIIYLILSKISETLIGGGRVEFRKLMIFSLRERKSRVARNPKTGVTINVSEKIAPFFKASKFFVKRIN